MPTNKLFGSQLDPVQTENCKSQLTYVQNLLLPYGQNLTPEERQRYGRINETNKLLVSKVREYHQTQPSLSSPDVNWAELEQSWSSRSGFEQIEALCTTVLEICSDARILHDYYLYQNALIDYNYTKYKAESSPAAGGFSSKAGELKQFFPNTGGGSSENKTEQA